MEFYANIAHQLFIGNTKIGDTFFRDPFEFIEEQHKWAPFKGKVFYSNLLRALPDHFGAKMFPEKFRQLAEYCGSRIAGIMAASVPATTGAPLTPPDQLMRDLQVIETIFHAQFQPYDPSNSFPYPSILDAAGKSGIDGRYINMMDLYATDEPFPLARYKAHFTERFEQTSNVTLVTSQLLQIREKAAAIVAFYNDRLSGVSPLVGQYLMEIPSGFEDSFEFKLRHAAVVVIADHRVSMVYLGVDRSTIRQRFIRHGEYAFNSIATNQDLAILAQSVVAFIDQFQLPDKKASRQKAIVPAPAINLSSLFPRSGDFERAIDALKRLQAIGAEGRNQIGKQLKGVIQVWVAILRKENRISYTSDQVLTQLLNQQFPGLYLSENTDGRHLRNRSKTAVSKYEAKLTSLLSA